MRRQGVLAGPVAAVKLLVATATAVVAPNAARADEPQELLFGARGKYVLSLRCHLARLGKLSPERTQDDFYDGSLVGAVKRFQRAHGLRQSGNVRHNTLTVLRADADGWVACWSAAASPSAPPPDRSPPPKAPKAAPPEPAKVPEAAKPPEAAAVPAPERPPAVPPNNAPTAAPAWSVTPGAMDRRLWHAPFWRASLISDTRAAVDRLRRVEAGGGFVRIDGKTTFTLDRPHPGAHQLCQRLAQEGLIDAMRCSGQYTLDLRQALNLFQHLNQLKQSDAIGTTTLERLNLPVAERISALTASLERLENGPAAQFDPQGRPFVVVNIPAQRLQFIENGVVKGEFKAVVGKPQSPSPQIAAFIVSLSLNPSWTPPKSIAAGLIAKQRRDPTYFERNGFHVRRIDANGQRGEVVPPHLLLEGKAGVVLERRPGRDNPLGVLRLDMPNPKTVYIHSTSQPEILLKSRRFESHGCVRVDDIVTLGALVATAGGRPLTAEELGARIARRAPDRTELSERIPLRTRVPVLWLNATSWADERGHLEYRLDHYASR